VRAATAMASTGSAMGARVLGASALPSLSSMAARTAPPSGRVSPTEAGLVSVAPPDFSHAPESDARPPGGAAAPAPTPPTPRRLEHYFGSDGMGPVIRFRTDGEAS
jgi:hypothetical protein